MRQDLILASITCTSPLPSGGETGLEVPNWSPWLRHCRGQHGRIMTRAEKRAAWEAEAERQRAITAEYGGGVS